MVFVTQSILLSALGWSLINSLWQMAILWTLYVIVTGNGRRFPASIRYRLGLILGTSGFLWFVSCFVFALIEGQNSRVPQFYFQLNTGGTPLLRLIYADFEKIITEATPFLAVAYLLALLGYCLRYLRYCGRLYELRRSGLLAVHPRVRSFVHKSARQLAIRQKIDVFLSSLVDCPLTIGYLRPLILLPVAMANHLSLEQVETVLLHELAHIKRQDFAVNLLVTAAEMTMFFNPFARLIVRAIKRERELCCDDQVMGLKYNPEIYASALLSLEQIRRRPVQHLVLAAAGTGDRLLLERVQRLVGESPASLDYKSWIRWLVFPLGVLFCILFQIPPRVVAVGSGDLAVNGKTHRLSSDLFRQRDAGLQISINPSPTATSPTKAISPPLSAKMDTTEALAEVVDLKPSDLDWTGRSENLSPLSGNNSQMQNTAENEQLDYSLSAMPKALELSKTALGTFPFVPKSSFELDILPDSSDSAADVISIDPRLLQQEDENAETQSSNSEVTYELAKIRGAHYEAIAQGNLAQLGTKLEKTTIKRYKILLNLGTQLALTQNSASREKKQANSTTIAILQKQNAQAIGEARDLQQKIFEVENLLKLEESRPSKSERRTIVHI